MKPLKPYIATLPVILGATLLACLMQPFFAQTDVAMIYLLAVVIAALLHGRGPAMLTAFVGVFVFDFFNVPPQFTLDLSFFDYSVTLLVMLLTALAVGTLGARLRRQLEESREQEARAAALYKLTAELADMTTLDAIVETVGERIRASFHAELQWFQAAEGDSQVLPATGPLLHKNSGKMSICLPLKVDGAIHALALVQSEQRWLQKQADHDHLAAMLGQAAQAIERLLLRRRIQETELQVQHESLRNSILNTISHDLRTPLASIIGASSSLIAEGENFSPEARNRLRQVINEEAVHLLDMVENLLDMARLQGTPDMSREWVALEEIADSATRALHRRYPEQEIRMQVPATLPLLRCDGVLIERVLINLLENAVRHAPTVQPLELKADVEGAQVCITVGDGGPGIPEELREKVFEAFFQRNTGSAGAGLGLAICRTIVEAHGGRIWITPNTPQGTQVHFTLLLPPVPPQLDQETVHDSPRP